MIVSFADSATEKVFVGESLSRKESRKYGGLDVNKAQERMAILNQASEQDLLTLPVLHYHALRGTRRCSIDANARRSKWRITFAWKDEQLCDVELVKIEDTH